MNHEIQLKLELPVYGNEIPDLEEIRTGAAAGFTAYQKPKGGIPLSDLAQDIQDKLLRAGKIFYATYEDTPAETVLSAIQEGQTVFVLFEGRILSHIRSGGHYAVFQYYDAKSGGLDTAIIYEEAGALMWTIQQEYTKATEEEIDALFEDGGENDSGESSNGGSSEGGASES